MSLDDGNANLWGLDVTMPLPTPARSTPSTPPPSNHWRKWDCSQATDWWRWVVRRGLLRNGRWNGKQYELEQGQVYVYIGMLRLLRQDTP
jgi:hypothetical protein